MTRSIAGIHIPDSTLAREVTELVRDTSTELLFHHSTRVYLFGALSGTRRGLVYDPELLYIGAMFHDIGLTAAYRHSHERFEVDGANAARDFMRRHGLPETAIETVWDAVALHTTPGIPQHKKPEVALVTAGVEMDVLGIDYHGFAEADRQAVVQAHPRTPQFKEDIIQAFADGMRHRPGSTFGTVNADVLADKDPHYARVNFCSVIRGSHWHG